MARLILDECASPLGLADALRGRGHYVVEAKRVGLKGKSDEEVIDYAETHDLIVVTTNLMHFATREKYCRAGGVIAVDDMPKHLLKERLITTLEDLTEEDLRYKFTHVTKKTVKQKA